MGHKREFQTELIKLLQGKHIYEVLLICVLHYMVLEINSLVKKRGRKSQSGQSPRVRDL